MATMMVGELLRTKDIKEVWAVAPNETVYHTLQKMSDKDIGAVLVVDGDQLVGIFSERDYARESIMKEKIIVSETQVREFMTSTLITVTPDHSVEECMNLMTDFRIRHLPVLEQGCLVGIVSIGDIVKAIITGQEKIINRLESYIIGTDYLTV